MMDALAVCFGAGEGIDAVVLRMAAVPLHPMPVDPMRLARFKQFLP